ncbi:MAG: response regulator [Gammaproteobacteria bacterium]
MPEAPHKTPTPETAQKTILIVDDSPENLSVLSELLESAYRVRATTSGRKALRIAGTRPRPDLILLDVMMPDMDGYQVFERLHADPVTRDIPVIFVTAMDNTEAQVQGLQAGAVDYISKPVVPSIVLARVHNQLELKQARDWLRDQNGYLEAEITKRMAENVSIQEVSIRALAHLAETRDPETGNHILRTQNVVNRLAQELRTHPRFEPLLTEHYIHLLTLSAPLHDIGKVGIPDSILLKPGPLTPEEWTIMKKHAQLGSEAIELAEQDAAEPVEFLSLAKEIAHWHHEKWDGAGYPDGLIGDSIPVSARIMALADVFDALISRRVYKQPMPYDEVQNIIESGRGQHFDPDMTDTFLANFSVFWKITDLYHDAVPV